MFETDEYMPEFYSDLKPDLKSVKTKNPTKKLT